MPPRKKREFVQPKLADTNIILRYLIGDDAPKAARATALMERVERGGKHIEIPPEVITEAVWTLASFYRVPRVEIAEKLSAILRFDGVISDAKDVMLAALKFFAESNADFVDCLLAARAKHQNTSVVTFDSTDFKRLSVTWEVP